MMQRLDIDIDQLVVNPAINPRHSDDDDVSDLVGAIRSKGFTDALWVRKVGDTFEIIDGSRRLRAVKWLKEHEGTRVLSLPCDVFDVNDEQARDMALAANVARRDLGPADEAQAFHSLFKGGLAVAEIAARYAATERFVKQRLGLGSLPEVILDALRKGTINVQTAEAFTLSPSPERQLAVFGEGRNLSAWTVKRALTENTVDADDGRVKLVGLEAYTAAGGAVSEDLFGDETYLLNADLLDTLAKAAVEALLAKYKNDGWKWVKLLDSNSAHDAYKFDRVEPKGKAEESPESAARCAALEAEQARLGAEYEQLEDQLYGDDSDDNPDDKLVARHEELAKRLWDIELELKGLTAKPFTEAQKKKLGVLLVLSISDFRVDLGRRLPGEGETERAQQDPDNSVGDAGDNSEATPAPVRDITATWSDTLADLLRMEAQKATQWGLACKSALAARMGLAERICVALHREHISPFTLSQNPNLTTGHKLDDLAKSQLERFKLCECFADVLAILETLEPEQMILIDGLLAAGSFEVTAFGNTDAQAVITLVDPDMRAEGFTVDAEFLGRLSRDQLLQVSAEVTPDAPIALTKKPLMVAALLPQLQLSNWLPPQLRTPSYQGPGSDSYVSSPALGAGEGGATATEEGQQAQTEEVAA